MDSQNNGTWQKWVIGVTSTIAFLFFTLWINSVAANTSELKTQQNTLSNQILQQENRVTVLEESRKYQEKLLEKMDRDLQAIKDAVTRTSK